MKSADDYLCPHMQCICLSYWCVKSKERNESSSCCHNYSRCCLMPAEIQKYVLILLQQPYAYLLCPWFQTSDLAFFLSSCNKQIHGQVGEPVRIQVIYERRYWRRSCSEMLHSWHFKIFYFCLILINSLVFKMKCVQFVHSVTLQDQLYT